MSVLFRKAALLLGEETTDLAQGSARELEAAGYEVSRAGDGLTALQLHAAPAPDLILLDWMLPKLDGLEVLRRLRRARAETLLRFSQAAVDSSIGVALRMLDAADVALGLRADRLDPQKKAILVGRILALRRSAESDPDPRQLLVAVDQLAAEMISDGGPWAPRDRS